MDKSHDTRQEILRLCTELKKHIDEANKIIVKMDRDGRLLQDAAYDAVMHTRSAGSHICAIEDLMQGNTHAEDLRFCAKAKEFIHKTNRDIIEICHGRQTYTGGSLMAILYTELSKAIIDGIEHIMKGKVERAKNPQ